METNQLLFIESGIHTLLSAPTLRKPHNESSLQFVLRGCFLFKWFQVEVFFIYCHSCLMCFYWKGRDRNTFDMQIPCSRSGCSLHSRECVWHGLLMTNGLSL